MSSNSMTQDGGNVIKFGAEAVYQHFGGGGTSSDSRKALYLPDWRAMRLSVKDYLQASLRMPCMLDDSSSALMSSGA